MALKPRWFYADGVNENSLVVLRMNTSFTKGYVSTKPGQLHYLLFKHVLAFKCDVLTL